MILNSTKGWLVPAGWAKMQMIVNSPSIYMAVVWDLSMIGMDKQIVNMGTAIESTIWIRVLKE